ncbi:MAG: hypothetical protein WCP97_07345 [bacterium]
MKEKKQETELLENSYTTTVSTIYITTSKSKNIKKRPRFGCCGCVFLLVAALSTLAYLSTITDPFSPNTIVNTPFTTTVDNGQIHLLQNSALTINNNGVYEAFSWFKSGYHMIVNANWGSPKAASEDEDGIINDIHTLRFDPSKPYLISGDHFSVLYPRNLGVFYLPTLDPRIARTQDEWELQQRLYLQTTAYTLETFSQSGKPSTTIVPTGSNAVTQINVYAYPSDALYGTLFALKTLQSPEELQRLYPFTAAENVSLETAQAGTELLDRYRENLQQLLDDYFHYVYDEQTGLVKTQIHLSGAKDITKRQGAFYDNVILWRTLQLAQDMEIMPSPIDLDQYRELILSTYWDGKTGHFLEDLSDESLQESYYSSDWLVVLFTGFLNPAIPNDRAYYEQSLQYIEKEGLARPFAIKYQQTDREGRQFPLVKTFLPSYGGSAIWSFWGLEYTKLNLLLYKQTNDQKYLQEAEYQLDRYKENIEKYRGFPEVYSENGEMIETKWYTSVRQTGWVVNYEQARGMWESVK